MSVEEKLYPPVIGSSIPAFYREGETGAATIAVPFSMNRAVGANDIKGFVLKIKTVQTNTQLALVDVEDIGGSMSIPRGVVYFSWNEESELQKLAIGQFLKVQLAYKDTNNLPGYFSTVAITKYTAKPEVYISELKDTDINTFRMFQRTYTGVYNPENDRSERPYSYIFSLYDKDEIVESSGWLLHNNSVNTTTAKNLQEDETTDTYTFKTSLKTDKSYYLQYGVRTINDLEVYSPLYVCIEPDISNATFAVELQAENVFEEGYIDLTFALQKKNIQILIDNTKYQLYKYHINNSDVYLIYDPEDSKWYDVNVNGSLGQEVVSGTREAERIFDGEGYKNNIEAVIYYKGTSSAFTMNDNNNVKVSIEILRAEITDNFQSWQSIKKLYFSSYEQVARWSFRDMTVEQGITYQYGFKQYNDRGLQSNLSRSNQVYADFEDMFLYDGEKQLKVRFNPKVSSFKNTRLEQKVDTIGSRYPFIFRNGVVNYKEFPIAGLISYHMDNNEMFIHHEEDLNIILGKDAQRDDGTPTAGEEWKTTETLDSIGYNMRAERRFKLKLMDWLSDGKIKLFRSPAEGNYLVRLLNISLTPEDKLGRMLHNFSSTAYEVEELNYDNLVKLGFISSVKPTGEQVKENSISIAETVKQGFVNKDTPIQLNEDAIVDFLKIDPSRSGEGGTPQFFLRIGADDEDHKVLITSTFELTRAGLTVNDNEPYRMPNIYVRLSDNEVIKGPVPNEDIAGWITDLFGDSVINYATTEIVELTGEFTNIAEVYIENRFATAVGPAIVQFKYDPANVGANDTEYEQTLKIFTLDFNQKKVFSNSESNRQDIYLYQTDSTHFFDANGDSVTNPYKVTATFADNTEQTFVLPDINITQALADNACIQLDINAGVILNYGYQVKVTKYKTSGGN